MGIVKGVFIVEKSQFQGIPVLLLLVEHFFDALVLVSNGC